MWRLSSITWTGRGRSRRLCRIPRAAPRKRAAGEKQGWRRRQAAVPASSVGCRPERAIPRGSGDASANALQHEDAAQTLIYFGGMARAAMLDYCATCKAIPFRTKGRMVMCRSSRSSMRVMHWTSEPRSERSMSSSSMIVRTVSRLTMNTPLTAETTRLVNSFDSKRGNPNRPVAGHRQPLASDVAR